MLEAAGWGLVAASSLVVGAAAGLWLPIPRRVVALLMAFGAGALTSAVTVDLANEAFKGGGTALTAIGLATGAVAFVAGDLALRRRAWRTRATGPAAEPGSTGGQAIVLGALLDGVPESVVLGATMLGGAGVSVSFLVAVLLSNLPEGVAGTRDLSDAGHGRGVILATWAGVAVVSAAAAGIGFAVLGGMSPGPVAVAQAFAAGAILAMLADTMFPEAFAHGGDAVGLATVMGFAAAFLLSAK